ncbi:MAG: hypothetical protein HYU28_04260 [Actinobacteria bacterium]|nr:hypothetical protein [Actinomycetota bacterium]
MDLRSLAHSFTGRAHAVLRRLRFPALVGGLGAIALALALASSNDDGPAGDRSGSDVVQVAPTSALRPEAAPDTYAIEYEVETGHETTTEGVVVRRPFDGRVERDGVTLISSLGLMTSVPVEGSPTAVAIPPEAAIGEVRLAAGAGSRRERRRITDVAECDVFRLAGGTERDHREVCLDARGLALEEIEVSGGRLVTRRVATAVDLDPRITPDLFDVAGVEPATPDQGGGSFVPLDDSDSAAADVAHETTEIPAGFRSRGRYALVPPRNELWVDPLGGQRRTAVVDLWVGGRDFLALEQGQTLGRVPAFEPDPSSPAADVPALPGAELHVGLRGAEVRVALDEGRYLRLYGTLPVPHLLAAAESLRATPDDG